MEAVADYDLIQAACDGVVVVVRPDHTNRKACFELIDKVPSLAGAFHPEFIQALKQEGVKGTAPH